MIKKSLKIIVLLTLIMMLSTSLMAQEQTTGESPAENTAESTQNQEISNAELFSEALNDFHSGNYALAEETIKTLLAKEDLDGDLKLNVLYYSVITAVERAKTAEAVNNLEKLEELSFKSGRLYWKIGELYLNKERQFDSADFQEALAYLKRAEEMGLNKDDFKRDLAYAYLENQEIQNAKNLYEELINNNPEAEDHLYFAQIKEKEGELNEAVKHYENALDLNASQSSLYLNLGNLYQQLGKDNSAISIFKQGIKVKENFVPYYIGLAESYIEKENFSEAKNILNKAVEINSNNYYAYFLLGNLAVRDEKTNDALNYYSEAIKNNPNYVQAYLAEGKIHLQREEYYRAISRFSLAVEKNPDYAESHYYLGRAYYQAEMLEAARSELRKTLHINNEFKDAREFLDKIEAELNID